MQRIDLSEAELELIGEHRYRDAHPFKKLPFIMLACYLGAGALALLALRLFPGTLLYLVILVPITIPSYIALTYSNQAKKAGLEFAGRYGDVSNTDTVRS